MKALLWFVMLVAPLAWSETPQAALLSPTPGSTLPAGSITFVWSGVPGADRYRLILGNTPTSSELASLEITTTSFTLTPSPVPSDGRTVFVRLAARVNGVFAPPTTTTYIAPGVNFLTWFVPMTPCRLMETRAAYNFEGRTGAFGPPALVRGETRNLNLLLSTNCFVPANAKAVVLNVTVIPHGPLESLTVYEAGIAQPNVTTIRSPDGQIVANSIIVAPAAGFPSGLAVRATDPTDVVIDISGYFMRTTAAPGLTYYPVTPCRAVETRAAYRAAGPFGAPSMAARETRRFRLPAAPNCSLPAAGAYSVTITAVPPGPLAYLTAWADGSTQPNISSINSFSGRVLANSLIVPAGEDGTIDVYAYDATDFIVDVTGYFAKDDGATGLFYYPIPQCRAYDTIASNAPFGDDHERAIPIPSLPGCANIVPAAKAYTLNISVLPNNSPMPFLTAWPTGKPRPDASMLNAFQGQTVTNSAIIPAGTGGSINVYTYRRTDLMIELTGYFVR